MEGFCKFSWCRNWAHICHAIRESPNFHRRFSWLIRSLNLNFSLTCSYNITTSINNLSTVQVFEFFPTEKPNRFQWYDNLLGNHNWFSFEKSNKNIAFLDLSLFFYYDFSLDRDIKLVSVTSFLESKVHIYPADSTHSPSSFCSQSIKRKGIGRDQILSFGHFSLELSPSSLNFV